MPHHFCINITCCYKQHYKIIIIIDNIFANIFSLLYFIDGDLLHTLYGRSPHGTVYFNNFQCPYNSTSFDDCEGNVTYSEECVSGDLEYVIQCFNVQSMFDTTL